METTITNFFKDFQLTIQKLRIAIPFIRKHRIWEGFWKYSWVAYPLLILGILVGLKFWSQETSCHSRYEGYAPSLCRVNTQLVKDKALKSCL